MAVVALFVGTVDTDRCCNTRHIDMDYKPCLLPLSPIINRNLIATVPRIVYVSINYRADVIAEPKNVHALWVILTKHLRCVTIRA